MYDVVVESVVEFMVEVRVECSVGVIKLVFVLMCDVDCTKSL